MYHLVNTASPPVLNQTSVPLRGAGCFGDICAQALPASPSERASVNWFWELAADMTSPRSSRHGSRNLLLPDAVAGVQP
jgi:hypothetical protein